ncbi:MAG: hypothetical protein QW797_04670 [Thermoproteota archaeon]|nr:hypothetical protein [Candidatus Bathyarchaeota archaeon]
MIKECPEAEGSYDVGEETSAFKKEKLAFEKLYEKLYIEIILREENTWLF